MSYSSDAIYDYDLVTLRKQIGFVRDSSLEEKSLGRREGRLSSITTLVRLFVEWKKY